MGWLGLREKFFKKKSKKQLTPPLIFAIFCTHTVNNNNQ